MQLYLENFCCYTKKHFTLPAQGSVLLTAPSGVGKTTIVKGIIFALYGTGQKIVKFGCKKCLVKLDYLGISITRTKGPQRLTVMTPEQTMIEDDEAQMFIDSIISRSSMCSLDQTTKNSFVHLSSSEKLVFLEKLALDENLDSLKNTLKQEIKELENRGLKVSTEIETLTQILGDLTLEANQYPHTPPTLSLVDLENSVCIQQQAMCKLEKDIEIHNDLYVKNEKISIQVDFIEKEQAKNLTKQRQLCFDENDLHANIDNHTEKLVSLKRLLEQYNKYEAHKLNVDKYNSLRVLFKSLQPNIYAEKISDIRQQLSKIPSQKTLDENISSLKRKLTSLQKYHQVKKQQLLDKAELTRLNSDNSLSTEQVLMEQLYEYQKNANNVTYSCPSCNSSLQIYKKKLRTVSPIDHCLLNEKIKDLEAQLLIISKLRHTVHSLQNTIKTNTMFLSEHVYLENINTDDVESELRIVLEQRVLGIKLNANLDEYLSETTTVTEQYDKLKEQLKNIREQCSVPVSVPEGYNDMDIGALRNKIALENSCIQELIMKRTQLLGLKKEYETYCYEKKKLCLFDTISILELDSKKSDLLSLKTSISKLQNEIVAYRQYETYFTLQNRIANYDNKMKTFVAENIKIKNYLLAHQKLRKIIQQAETRSINNIIHTINMNLQLYLDAFFLDFPMVVTLVTTKIVKKVETASIELEIRYKEEDIGISTLSGGELSRLVLAFALVISEINNSPLIILDESLSTLDSENCSNVYDYIKENSGGKLIIIVAHQIITGMFDHVIELRQE